MARKDDDQDGVDAGSAAEDPFAAFSSLSATAMETLTQNMMEAAARSNTLLSAALAAQSEASARGADPDPFNIAPDAARLMGQLASDPNAIVEAQTKLWTRYMGLWSSAATRMAGGAVEPSSSAGAKDRRFRAPEWSEHPYFELIKNCYLASSEWMVETVSSVEGVDEQTKRKVAFFAQQLADAFAPTNFPLTNPDVLRAAAETGGENFIQGVTNLAEDLKRGRGKLAIRQTMLETFEIGRDVATAPGQVVFRNRMFELLHYAPSTPKTYATPLLIFPPWINKFYILDLRPENSMIRWLTDKGYAVFLVSWVNPDASLAEADFETYIREGIHEALAATLEQTGAAQANCVGYCIGGTLLASALAEMSQEGDERINSATYFAAQTDFSEAGDLLMFVDDDWLKEIERRMDAGGGVLDGQTMADTFNMLRANDLIWSFVVNNYLLGKQPKAFDLLFWNSDATRLAKGVHLYYLEHFYRQNALSEGRLPIGGRMLSLSDIQTPSYLIATRDDHIAPYISVYKGAAKFAGDVRFVLSGSGHIAGVINPPAAKKYQYWINDAAPSDVSLGDWLTGAEEHPGSWWDDWHTWLSKRSGAKVDALAPEDGPLDTLEPAPGSYVKVRG